ncbi:MAG: HxlR family transcriptional regulator [Bdellovibrionales bacterium RBG_16_40_8]|nr:MAG: HxlR family transcriptional regulator [Bdellovibrionales bacterium RBG_16_40_8]
MRIIGGKWKSVILWNIKERTMRFGELKREISGITVKMLAQQLRELEQDGIISRKMYYEVPPRVEYSLTETGKSLIPILQVLADWGMKYKEIYMG